VIKIQEGLPRRRAAAHGQLARAMPHARHYRSIIHGMSEPTGAKAPARPITPLQTGLSTSTSSTQASPAAGGADDRMPCDRCGADMYRMHAVWRCPACGFKTDCCGW
jgi:hypothetical protein